MSGADGWSRRALIGAGASAGAAMLLPGVAGAAAPYVRTPSGDFVGESDRGVTAYRGIRYGVAQRVPLHPAALEVWGSRCHWQATFVSAL